MSEARSVPSYCMSTFVFLSGFSKMNFVRTLDILWLNISNAFVRIFTLDNDVIMCL